MIGKGFGIRAIRKVIQAVALGLLCKVLVTIGAQACLAQGLSHKRFDSAQKATHALFIAVQADDKAALIAILGAGKNDLFTDDTRLDRLEREQFVLKYKQMRRLVREPNGTTVLCIGAENWPFPYPLVATNAGWRFDSAAGSREIKFRRIGENETAAIEDCMTLVRADAPLESIPEGGTKLMHGYYFRSLMPQSYNPPIDNTTVASNARTSARFAFAAYPAEYRASGVMTFMVSQDGIVYAKDLGPESSKHARLLTDARPDSTWTIEK